MGGIILNAAFFSDFIEDLSKSCVAKRGLTSKIVIAVKNEASLFFWGKFLKQMFRKRNNTHALFGLCFFNFRLISVRMNDCSVNMDRRTAHSLKIRKNERTIFKGTQKNFIFQSADKR